MSGTQTKLEAALGLARRGFLVIPLHHPLGTGCSCKVAACNAVGKHPRIKGWREQGTTDVEIITEWFTRWPDANIGIVTGKKSGIFVLDVDNKNADAGERSLDELIKTYGSLPPTLTVKTGGGLHFYFAAPKEPIKNSTSSIAPGLDIRGEGGFVVAASSVHRSGHHYEFIGSHVSIAQAPAWLLDLVTTETVAAGEQEQDRGPCSDVAIEGTRNTTIFKAVCGLFEHGMGKNDLYPIALQFNQLKCKPPLPDSEVKAIVESASRYDHASAKKYSKPASRRSPLYWFPFHVEEYLTDFKIMTMKDYQFGWHLKLLAYAWKTGGILPNDPKRLACLAAASASRFDREKDVALYGFEEKVVADKPVLIHRQLSEMYADALEKWMQKKEAGRLAAALYASGRQIPQVPGTAIN